MSNNDPKRTPVAAPVSDPIDLMALARDLWKNILAIALVAVLVGSAAFAYTAFMVSPQYQATAALYVNSSSVSLANAALSISAGQLSTSSYLVSTYVYILKSRTTLEEVIKEADLKYSPGALKGMISTRSVPDTAAFEVTVTSRDPAEAELIANAIAQVLPDRVSEIVDGSAVRIVDYAIIPARRSGPDLMGSTMKGIMAGAALAAALVVLKNLLDEKSRTMIPSSDALRAMYPDIMVLAQIPDVRGSERKGYYSSYYYKNKKSAGGATQKRHTSGSRKNPRAAEKACEFMTYSGREAFKRLRTNVLLAFPEDNGKCKVIGITSAQVSEGKSTVSLNLAYSLAELGKRVMLIDGDMRRPTVHEKVGVRVAPGLSEVLLGSDELSKSVTTFKSTTDDTLFNMIPSGTVPDNPSELLNSERFEKLLGAVSNAYDYVIIDLPPVNAVIDAVNVSQYADGVVVVMRENHCPRFVMSDCIEQLHYAKANILGFVMNGCTEGAGKRYQYGQYYYHRYYK